MLTKADHLPLFLAIAQIIQVLHADELGPAVLLGDELHAGELRRPHRACTNVAHFAGLDKVVEGFHGFFKRGSIVEAMDLKEVDVGGSKTGEGGVDGVEDGGAG